MTARELVVGVVLLLIGGALLWSWTLAPARQVWDARGWQETTCTVSKSEVIEQSDGSFVVPVTYTFTLDGTVHDGSSAGLVDQTLDQAEAKAKKARWEAGSESTCWVDPRDPSRSTLDRSGSWTLAGGWFGLLLMIPILGAFFRKPASGAVAVDTTKVIAGQLAVASVLALVATVLFVVSIVVGGEWGLAAVLVLGLGGVLLVGLWGLVGLGVARLFRTRVQVEIDALVEGQPAKVRWTSSRPLQTLKIQLVGIRVENSGDASVRTEVYRSGILSVRPGRASGTDTAQIDEISSATTEWHIEVHGTDDRGALVFSRVQVEAPGPKE